MTFRSLALITLFAAACPAGVIVTADGVRYEGDIQRADGGWYVVNAAGKRNFVATSNVKSIEMSGGTSNAAEGLKSLRRSVEASDDLPKIVDRYKKFIDQTTDPAVAADAKQDLAVWQDRLDRKLEKLGNKWVTADEKASIEASASQAAEDARLLMKSGQSKEAAAMLDAAAQRDGSNISVLYLQGVLADAHGDPIGARKAFAAVQQQAPMHAPTLLNLAVLGMRMKQWGFACVQLDAAMNAAPGAPTLIDAAAELLAMLPDDQRRTTAALKFAKTFGDQDQSLQHAMAAKKMYRWGSTWVDQAAKDKLDAAQAAADKKVADLQSDFDLTQGRIKAIDSETNENSRSMRDMEAHSWVPTADGTYVRAPLPTAYFDLQRRNAQIHGERVEMANRLDALRDAAKHARDDLPVPKFTGKVALIGEDGMPVINGLPNGGAAAPATNPAAATSTATMPATTQPPIIKIGPAD